MPGEDAWRLALTAGLVAGFGLAWWLARRHSLAELLRSRLRVSRFHPAGRARHPLPGGRHLRVLAPVAYSLSTVPGYLVPMAKEHFMPDAALPPLPADAELQALLAGRRLTAELQRAYEDYLRLRSALGWLSDLEPDNEVAIAMVRGDASRAEVRLLRLLREAT